MRAVLGVVLGYAVWTALWLGGGQAVHAAYPAELDAFAAGEPLTSTAPLGVTLALSVLCSLVAGFTTSRVVGQNANKPVLLMAVLLLLTGIGVQASVWNLMPLPYHVAFLALLVPVCLLGARRRLETN